MTTAMLVTTGFALGIVAYHLDDWKPFGPTYWAAQGLIAGLMLGAMVLP